MVNKFTQIGIIQKIIILLIFIMLFEFAIPNHVKANWGGEGIGGALLKPIMDLLLFLGDGVLNILQHSFITSLDVTVSAKSKDYSSVNGWAIAGIVVGAVLCIVGGLAIVGTIGVISGTVAAGSIATVGVAGATSVIASLKTIAGGVACLLGGLAGTVYCAKKTASDWSGEFSLPVIAYSPAEIFSNQIPLFDINFINPHKNIIDKTKLANLNITELNEMLMDFEEIRDELIANGNDEEADKKMDEFNKKYDEEMMNYINLLDDDDFKVMAQGKIKNSVAVGKEENITKYRILHNKSMEKNRKS